MSKQFIETLNPLQPSREPWRLPEGPEAEAQVANVYDQAATKQGVYKLLTSQDGSVTISVTDKTVDLSAGGGGGGSGGGGVQKTGDTMSGPLAIATATQPELHVADAASGPQTLDVNNNGLTLKDATVGNSVRITLGQVLVQGTGAETGGSANRTTIGVNNLSLGHKSYVQGTSPSSISQSNQGELYLNASGGPLITWTDLRNGHGVRVSTDAGNRLTYGSDGCPFLAVGATTDLASADGTAENRLEINSDGDLIITQLRGPNAGKSVNLTYGRWT